MLDPTDETTVNRSDFLKLAFEPVIEKQSESIIISMFSGILSVLSRFTNMTLNLDLKDCFNSETCSTSSEEVETFMSNLGEK